MNQCYRLYGLGAARVLGDESRERAHPLNGAHEEMHPIYAQLGDIDYRRGRCAHRWCHPRSQSNGSPPGAENGQQGEEIQALRELPSH